MTGDQQKVDVLKYNACHLANFLFTVDSLVLEGSRVRFGDGVLAPSWLFSTVSVKCLSFFPPDKTINLRPSIDNSLFLFPLSLLVLILLLFFLLLCGVSPCCSVKDLFLFFGTGIPLGSLFATHWRLPCLVFTSCPIITPPSPAAGMWLPVAVHTLWTECLLLLSPPPATGVLNECFNM